MSASQRSGQAQGALGLGEGSARESEAHSRSYGMGGWTMEKGYVVGVRAEWSPGCTLQGLMGHHLKCDGK